MNKIPAVKFMVSRHNIEFLIYLVVFDTLSICLIQVYLLHCLTGLCCDVIAFTLLIQFTLLYDYGNQYMLLLMCNEGQMEYDIEVSEVTSVSRTKMY